MDNEYGCCILPEIDMRRVIKGKTYNTVTAAIIGSDSFGYLNDFDHWNESLYRTKKGAYFLAGSGGARTKYAIRSDRNTYYGGERIFPVTYEEALAWCEAHGVSPDHFPERENA